MWELSQGWYGDRLDPDYRPPSLDEVQAMLSAVGLTDDFWQLTPPV